MSPEVPNEKLALQVWWSISWRAIPLSFIAGSLIGGVLGAVLGSMGASVQSIQTPAMIMGALVGIYINVQVIKRLMTKGFGDYRLAVVRK